MLARRFTIVCLIVALFGAAFSVLVAEAHRQSSLSHWQTSACHEFNCPPSWR
jgi:hypothetical protein